MTSALFSLSAQSELARGAQADQLLVLKGALLLHDRLMLWSTDKGLQNFLDVVGAGLTAKLKNRLGKALGPVSAAAAIPDQVHLSDIVKEYARILSHGDELDEAQTAALLHDLIEGGTEHPQMRSVLALYLTFKSDLPYYARGGELAGIEGIWKQRQRKADSQKVIEVVLPDLAQLSMADIIELRANPYLQGWREFVRSQPDSNKAAQRVNDAMWDVIGGIKPRKDGSVVSRIAANLPVPILNPYAVGKDVHDLVKEKQTFNRYGFVFFIQSVRARAADA